jgi:hypothetical protein
VVLATDDVASTKKRFLSRTARYSGLLNILEFSSANLKNDDEVSTLLQGANAWIAFNLTQPDVKRLSNSALSSQVQRVIFTMQLPIESIEETSIPEFDSAINSFATANPPRSLTVFRHGDIIDGDEDNPYEIVNATIPCMEATVERGVLARIVAETLSIGKSSNAAFGVSSSGPFSSAYLNVLRSSGLTRSQEVEKMLTGGLQRVARLTVNEYEAQKTRDEEAKLLRQKKKVN